MLMTAVSGMVMTYNSERVVPDSSPTASAWSTGNKTGDGTHGVFADNNDFRFSAANKKAGGKEDGEFDDQIITTGEIAFSYIGVRYNK